MSIQQAPLANSQTILPALADVEKFNCATCMQKYKEARAMFHTVIKHQPLEENLETLSLIILNINVCWISLVLLSSCWAF